MPRSYFKKQIGHQKNNLNYNYTKLTDPNLDANDIPYLLNNKEHLENELKYFQDGLLNRKSMVNRSEVGTLKKYFKNSKNTSTNDIAKYVEDKDLDYIKLKNVSDNLVGTETIMNHKPGNYLKSTFGNNGMFDMTNPNIYKAVVPAAGLYGLTQSNKQGGTIHIKPENVGKFTATKEATGKSTEELTHSKNPITKKRAVFALNSRKWKHQEGGLLYPNVNQLVNRTNAKNIDFVNRLKDPKRKFITNWENPKQIATHKMGWATDDKGAVIYPEVQNINGKLIDFTRPPYNKWAGYNSAVQRGDTIQTTSTIANEYTKNYKKFYPTF